MAELLAPASQRRPPGSACSACGWTEPRQGRPSARLPGFGQSGSRPSPPCLSAASVPSAGPPRASPESAWSPPELAHYGSFARVRRRSQRDATLPGSARRSRIASHFLLPFSRDCTFRGGGPEISAEARVPRDAGAGKRIPARNRGGFCAGQRIASGWLFTKSPLASVIVVTLRLSGFHEQRHTNFPRREKRRKD